MPSPTWQPCVDVHDWMGIEITTGFGYENACVCRRCGILVFERYAP